MGGFQIRWFPIIAVVCSVIPTQVKAECTPEDHEFCQNYELKFTGSSSGDPRRFSNWKVTEEREFVINSRNGLTLQDCMNTCNAYPIQDCAGVYYRRKDDGQLNCIGMRNVGDDIGVGTTADDYSFIRFEPNNGEPVPDDGCNRQDYRQICPHHADQGRCESSDPYYYWMKMFCLATCSNIPCTTTTTRTDTTTTETDNGLFALLEEESTLDSTPTASQSVSGGANGPLPPTYSSPSTSSSFTSPESTSEFTADSSQSTSSSFEPTSSSSTSTPEAVTPSDSATTLLGDQSSTTQLAFEDLFGDFTTAEALGREDDKTEVTTDDAAMGTTVIFLAVGAAVVIVIFAVGCLAYTRDKPLEDDEVIKGRLISQRLTSRYNSEPTFRLHTTAVSAGAESTDFRGMYREDTNQIDTREQTLKRPSNHDSQPAQRPAGRPSMVAMSTAGLGNDDNDNDMENSPSPEWDDAATYAPINEKVKNTNRNNINATSSPLRKVSESATAIQQRRQSSYERSRLNELATIIQDDPLGGSRSPSPEDSAYPTAVAESSYDMAVRMRSPSDRKTSKTPSSEMAYETELMEDPYADPHRNEHMDDPDESVYEMAGNQNNNVNNASPEEQFYELYEKEGNVNSNEFYDNTQSGRHSNVSEQIYDNQDTYKPKYSSTSQPRRPSSLADQTGIYDNRASNPYPSVPAHPSSRPRVSRPSLMPRTPSPKSSMNRSSGGLYEGIGDPNENPNENELIYDGEWDDSAY
eukprot:m.7773 g.7773  ORF g.7773 m.7773 type:complete len:748 (-) comp3772_c0_seq2:53-2296(-)